MSCVFYSLMSGGEQPSIGVVAPQCHHFGAPSLFQLGPQHRSLSLFSVTSWSKTTAGFHLLHPGWGSKDEGREEVELSPCLPIAELYRVPPNHSHCSCFIGYSWLQGKLGHVAFQMDTLPPAPEWNEHSVTTEKEGSEYCVDK